MKHHYRIEVLMPGDKWVCSHTWWAMNRSKADGAWMVLKAFSGDPTHRYRLVKYPLPGDAQTPGEVVEEFTPYTVALA